MTEHIDLFDCDRGVYVAVALPVKSAPITQVYAVTSITDTSRKHSFNTQ